ncbi:response regulator transcription factor [Trichococcus sp.]|uniref:response regulator transcription factor n=1 Tax=Trichococcus sp. TaxID=1985464 RepID=UPI003C799605
MQNKLTILLIEDEQHITDFLTAILLSNDYTVLKAASGKEGMALMTSYNPDLILLDLGLPDIDGMEVLKKIRTFSAVPVMVVSARGNEREKVEALDCGADDYVTKPFSTSELLARIRTSLRHSLHQVNTSALPAGSFSVGELTIDYEKRKVAVRKKEVHLTPNEYKIVVLLSQYAGRVLTHDFITKAVWGPYMDENRTLRVNMANIRRKIEKNQAEPEYILTEIGVGYRMVEELEE